MVTIISHSPAETEALGESWGRAARPGLVLALAGDLGAGKTQLVKGIARGLDIPARVHSPTFALVNTYAGGRLPLFHLDVYRLDTLEQIHAAGLEEFLTSAGVTVIEWADRWFQSPTAKPANPCPKAGAETAADDFPGGRPSALAPAPATLRWVGLETLTDTTRRITYEPPGA
jgi:tRNA threonylcarbamoyladenosine biosynthesis protein TsaE